MAQLDRLLSAMIANKAEALTLDEGEPAKMELPSGARPVTKSPLTAQQVVGLLREIAPVDVGRQLETQRQGTFTYTSGDGTFSVTAAQEGGKWRARLTSAVMEPAPTENGGYDPLSAFQTTGSFMTPLDMPRVMPTPAAAASPVASAPSPARAPTPPATPAPAASPAPNTPPPIRPAAFDTTPAPSARAAAPSPAEVSSAPRSLDAVHAFAGIDDARAEIEQLLRTTVERGASDLHLRCGEPPIIRLHGEMHRLEGKAPLENDRLEMMLRSIMPERNRIEYLESNDTDYAYEIPGCARFRANALKDRLGSAAVFRQIPSQVVNVDQMGITPEVQQLCYLTKGLVLVTGPTGSGKSTTLCALIDMVNRVRNDHVITIEDPIEFVHPNKNCIITQRQVGVHTKSFKSALRAALREDPDIILVGELRDLETVSIAIETAETGHLVFGTLHTTTAPGTIDRIIDQFPADRQEQIRVMLADSLKGVISQTLCKKIGGGRVAAREILLSIPSVANLIREAKTFQINSIIQTSRRLGMVTLSDALMEYVDAGVVEPKEAYMKAVDKLNFMATLKQRGHDVTFAETDLASQGQGKPDASAPAKSGMKPLPKAAPAKR